MEARLYTISDFMKVSDLEPIRTVITESSDAVIVAWHLEPGQNIPLHTHPYGQDSWTVIKGRGDYFLDANGSIQKIKTGDVVVARKGEPHGAINSGVEPLEFISVVSPGNAGYALLDAT